MAAEVKQEHWLDPLIKIAGVSASGLALGVAIWALIVANRQLGKLTDNVEVASRSLEVASRSLAITVLDNSGKSSLKMSEVFLDRPELRKFFYGGEDINEGHKLYPH